MEYSGMHEPSRGDPAVSSGPVAGDAIPAAARVIELRLSQLRRLFDQMDPSPFFDRDLDPKAEEFILGWCRELPREASLALVIYLEREPGAPDESVALGRAVRNYFGRRSAVTRQRLRQMFRQVRLSHLIGVGFLVLTVTASQMMMKVLDPGGIAEVLNQSLIIGGWVALWRPLEIFLYDWWPVRADRMRFDRLAVMPVQIRYVPGGNALSPVLDWPFTEHQQTSAVHGTVTG
jgi:hypothetical protein